LVTTGIEAVGSCLAVCGGQNAKKRSVLAVARKLLIIMYRLWKKQESFVAFTDGCDGPQTAA
jgi:hypothetical protein